MCLDWTGVKFNGEDPAVNTRTVDVMFIPCSMKESMLAEDWKEEDRTQDCNYDKEALFKYLGPLQMIVYKNEGSFQLDEFGNKRI